MSKVLLGVSGGVAAYKTPGIVSGLLALDHEVTVVMTENAKKFIEPRCYRSRVIHDMWESHSAVHVELSEWADAIVIAPATANIIGKFANGIADDLLTTLILAVRTESVRIIYPSMNTRMLNNPAVQRNMCILSFWGWDVQRPETGMLQCGTEGAGKMPSSRDICVHVDKSIGCWPERCGRKMFREPHREETLCEYANNPFVKLIGWE